MAKAKTRAREAGPLEAPNDELSSSVLGTALMCEPAARDAVQVQQALEWWLEQLPASGLELAQELRAPGQALLEAFRRGRMAVCPKGHRLQDEGDEVRHYTIVLLGRVRLRCRPPAPKTGTTAPAEVAEDEEQAAALDSDGCVGYETLGRGEALGLVPLEARSPCEVHCLERSTVLLVGPDDYAATLRPYHRELQTQAVDFLQQRSICPLGTSLQLQRLVCAFRHRRVGRGAMVMRAGEHQGHVWILRSGSCSVLSNPQEDQQAVAAEEEEEPESSEESEDEVSRLERMRALPTDAEGQQATAAAKAREAGMSKYARPFLQRTMQTRAGRKHSNSKAWGHADSSGLTVTALLRESGLIFGEEVLLYDSRRQMTARCCTTIRADEECHFYLADVTTFRQLVMYIGVESIAERVSEKFARRTSLSGRNGKVAKRLAKQAQQLKMAEMRKQENQRIRLPPSVGGPEYIEDVNQYLRVVFDHRKAPRNDKNPQTLSVLEGLGLTPLGTSGHGINAMLKLYEDPSALKMHRAKMRWGSGMAGRRNLPASRNPMGEVVPSSAKYMEAAPPSRAAIELPASTAGPVLGGGIFFQTEPDLEDRETQPPARSSSVPVLPPLAETGMLHEQTLYAPKKPLAHSGSWRGSSSAGMNNSERGRQEKAAQSSEKRAVAQVMKAFHRSVPGKSILILCDRAEVRKSIMKALLSAATEVDLVFVKRTAELWHRLGDMKEKHHALILDLAKTELQVEGLLKCCRGHERYGGLPIIVLAADRNLSEAVRTNCSFVVFHPLAPAMLREALVWVFDRKSIMGSWCDDGTDSASISGQSKGQQQGAPKDLEFHSWRSSESDLSILPTQASPAIAVS